MVYHKLSSLTEFIIGKTGYVSNVNVHLVSTMQSLCLYTLMRRYLQSAVWIHSTLQTRQRKKIGKKFLTQTENLVPNFIFKSMLLSKYMTTKWQVHGCLVYSGITKH